MIGSGSGNVGQTWRQPRRQACGPEHRWHGGPLDSGAASDAVQWHLLRSQLIHLVRWPEPQHLPADLPWAQVARVCALLSRRPSVGMRVAQLLAIDPQQCQQLLLALQRQGCLQLAAVQGAAAAEPAAAAVLTPAGGFVQRLWRRLAGLAGN